MMRTMTVDTLRALLAEQPGHYAVGFPYTADPDDADWGVVAFASHVRIEQPANMDGDFTPVVVIR